MFHIYKGTRISPSVKESSIDAIEKFKFREDDVLIATYPKSGELNCLIIWAQAELQQLKMCFTALLDKRTHWINEITQLILNDGDSTRLTHSHRRTPLEITDVINLANVDLFKATVDQVQTDESPRVLMTHLRPRHFPEQTWSMRIPIIYVLRNPMDVFLSLFEFICNFILPTGEPYMTKDNWSDYMKLFVDGDVVFDSWCDHVIQYEELVKRKENVLFLTYEEMKKDIRTVIKRIAEHIRHDVTDDVVEKVAANSTLEAMKVNYGKAMESRKEMKIAEEATSLFLYVKKGIAGRWRTEYPPDKWKSLQDAFKERVKDTIYAKQYFDY